MLMAFILVHFPMLISLLGSYRPLPLSLWLRPAYFYVDYGRPHKCQRAARVRSEVALHRFRSLQRRRRGDSVRQRVLQFGGLPMDRRPETRLRIPNCLSHKKPRRWNVASGLSLTSRSRHWWLKNKGLGPRLTPLNVSILFLNVLTLLSQTMLKIRHP